MLRLLYQSCLASSSGKAHFEAELEAVVSRFAHHRKGLQHIVSEIKKDEIAQAVGTASSSPSAELSVLTRKNREGIQAGFKGLTEVLGQYPAVSHAPLQFYTSHRM